MRNQTTKFIGHCGLKQQQYRLSEQTRLKMALKPAERWFATTTLQFANLLINAIVLVQVLKSLDLAL